MTICETNCADFRFKFETASNAQRIMRPIMQFGVSVCHAAKSCKNGWTDRGFPRCGDS